MHKSKMKIIITAITMTTTTTITTTSAITVHEVVISVEYAVVFNISKLIHILINNLYLLCGVGLLLL